MKVYIVYDAYYSEIGIRRVFTTKDLADKYIAQLKCPEDNVVEEHVVEDEITECCSDCGKPKTPDEGGPTKAGV